MTERAEQLRWRRLRRLLAFIEAVLGSEIVGLVCAFMLLNYVVDALDLGFGAYICGAIVWNQLVTKLDRATLFADIVESRAIAAEEDKDGR